jgi:hypothetical protein
MSGGKWQEKIEKFRALDAADKWMLLHATVWLALACIMLLVLPFQQLAKRLSAGEQPAETRPEPELLRRIGYAVLPQSIAGWMLLKHHGYNSTIHLGVEKKGNEELAGHAWLTCGGIVVTGGEGLDRYAEIHSLGA